MRTTATASATSAAPIQIVLRERLIVPPPSPSNTGRRGHRFRLARVLRLLVALAINVLALWVANALFGGVRIHGAWGYIIGAAVLGVANGILKPLLALLTLPLIILTLGVFYFLINIAMLVLAEWIAPSFSVDGFWTYAGAVVIIWLVNWAAHSLLDELDNRWPRARLA